MSGNNTAARWYPRLQGQIPAAVDEAHRITFDNLYTLRDKLNAAIETIPPPGPTLAEIKAALENGGRYPLNVTNLEGTLGQSQDAQVPILAAVPSSGDGYSIGALIDVKGQLWIWTGSKWQPIGLIFIQDTHAHRLLNYPPENYQVGTLFWETDRRVTYLLTLVNGGAPTWQYQSGIMRASHANMPADLSDTLTENDDGFMFYATTFHQLYIWQNSTVGWLVIAGIYDSLLANRPATLTTSDIGFQFHSSDYDFLERWDGTNWIFISGTGEGAFAALAGMASVFTGPETGYTYFDKTYFHEWLWNGAGWQLVGDSQYIVIAPAAPQGGVWYPCDGAPHTCVTSTAGTVSVTPPNLNGTVAAIFGGGYNATVVPATAPTLSGNVGVTIGNDTDAGINILSAGNNSVALHPHTHTATVTQPVIKAPSANNGGLPALFTMSFWLRA